MNLSKYRERRRQRRCDTHWPAQCFADEWDEWRVIIVNASEGGFGLSIDLPLDIGDTLQIIVDDVGVFPCRVAWKNGERCGLELLSDDDLHAADRKQPCKGRFC